jgi:hypothetical protein
LTLAGLPPACKQIVKAPWLSMSGFPVQLFWFFGPHRECGCGWPKNRVIIFCPRPPTQHRNIRETTDKYRRWLEYLILNQLSAIPYT